MCAMKEMDETNPQTKDVNWQEGLLWYEMNKYDEWLPYRLVGGIFTYAQHWIEFTNKAKETKRYPVDCVNWDSDKERASLDNGCPCCALSMTPRANYMFNVIDRAIQDRGDKNPIRAFVLPPTVYDMIKGLKALNLTLIDGKKTPFSVTHPLYGCDVHIKWSTKTGKRGGGEWQVQKGDKAPLTDAEKELELFEFDKMYVGPQIDKIRADLRRHGYYDDVKGDDAGSDAGKGKKDEEEDAAPRNSSKRSMPSEEDAQPSRKTREQTEEKQETRRETKREEPAEDPKPAKTKLGQAPPENGTDAKKPCFKEATGKDSFGDFLGDTICIKCPFKQPCLAAGNS